MKVKSWYDYRAEAVQVHLLDCPVGPEPTGAGELYEDEVSVDRKTFSEQWGDGEPAYFDWHTCLKGWN